MHSSAAPEIQLSINRYSLKTFLHLVYTVVVCFYWSELASRLNSIKNRTMAVVLRRLSERTLSAKSPIESQISVSTTSSCSDDSDECDSAPRFCDRTEGLRLSFTKVAQKRNLDDDDEEHEMTEAARAPKSPSVAFSSLPPLLISPDDDEDEGFPMSTDDDAYPTFVKDASRSCPTSLVCPRVEEPLPGSEGPRPIEADRVAQLILSNSRDLLLVDCRSFMKYNANRIVGSLNACCTNPTIKKRFRDGKIGVAELISGAEDKARFREAAKSGSSCLVVIYDDASSSEDAVKSSCLSVVASRLDDLGLCVRFLSGGLNGFSSAYGHLCTKPEAMEQRPLLFSPTSPYVDAAIDSTVMTRILDHLFLGNEKDAADLGRLKANGVTHVLNVSASIPLFCEEHLPGAFRALRIPASDSGSQNIKQYFEAAIEFIEEARAMGGKVLVHCQAGVSRSPTITIAYLMSRFGHTSLDAFGVVKAKRSIVSPNINFMGQLLEFESRLGLSRSTADSGR